MNEKLIISQLEKLRDEINNRLAHQIQILSILLSGNVALLGIIFGYKIYVLILLIPIFTIGCGLLYVSWQFGIQRIGEYIYYIEDKYNLPYGWEHYLRKKLYETKAFSGNFYPLAVTFILVFPTITAWILFFIFIYQHQIVLRKLYSYLCGIYFILSLLLILFILLGLKITLWEFKK